MPNAAGVYFAFAFVLLSVLKTYIIYIVCDHMKQKLLRKWEVISTSVDSSSFEHQSGHQHLTLLTRALLLNRFYIVPRIKDRIFIAFEDLCNSILDKSPYQNPSGTAAILPNRMHHLKHQTVA